MAKPEIAINKNEIPEGLNLMSFEMVTLEQVRFVIRNMKQFALNNYLALAKINSTRAFELLGHATIEDFVRVELKGIISYRNAIGFLDYIQDQDDVDLLDNDSIVKLLGICKEGKAEKKEKTPNKEKLLKSALKLKEEEVEQKELELESLKIKLNDIALEKNIDPDRMMMLKTEESTREYLEKNRIKAIQSIQALRTIDPDNLKLVGYGELRLIIGSISSALNDLNSQYVAHFDTEEFVSRLEQ